MQAINRKTAPAFGQLEKIDIIRASEKKLDNGILLYYVSADIHDLVKIEFIFPAGKWFDTKPMISFVTNKMLTEGTKNKTAAEIAAAIDYYGAFLQTETTADFATVCIFSLNKHLSKLLPVVKEILTEPLFPEKEKEIFIRNKKQQLEISNEQVDYTARKKFAEALFGSAHPYGHYVKPEEYDAVEQQYMISFYRQHYNYRNCRIIVSGKADDNVLSLVNRTFGTDKWNDTGESSLLTMPVHTPSPSPVKNNHFEKKDAVQFAIRIGKPLFNKTHHDYPGLQVLNTVLGGYFGSRLMSNIREDKGFTYGIGSALVSLTNAGYLYIATEVGAEVCNRAVDEIYAEIARLAEEPVGKDELQLVRNYIMGTFLKSIDGPFALADKFKAIMLYGLDYSYYDTFISTVQNITPDGLLGLAKKYFGRDTFYQVTVGKSFEKS